MLEIILKGILIGLCISVPVGPIGMLVIQRTLNRGRKFGIATGLGASMSDLFYTIITLFFLSFVIDFIEAHRFIIELVGSLVVIFFGYFIYKNNPAVQPKPNETVQHNVYRDFISSFVLTFSNPLFLFVLIALFARIKFIHSGTSLFETILGILAILIGATLWWMTLTYIVSHFRSKIGMHQLKAINQITGGLISLIGCIGLVSSLI